MGGVRCRVTRLCDNMLRHAETEGTSGRLLVVAHLEVDFFFVLRCGGANLIFSFQAWKQKQRARTHRGYTLIQGWLRASWMVSRFLGYTRKRKAGLIGIEIWQIDSEYVGGYVGCFNFLLEVTFFSDRHCFGWKQNSSIFKGGWNQHLFGYQCPL